MSAANAKKNQLEQLKIDIVANNVCSSLAANATQLVMGHGNPDADIVFIGEAPGKNEDLQGQPFIGAAGRLLDEMLITVGLDRADVYITNIVKYRPPENRDPLPAEKKAFWPFLTRELQIIKPKIIATLGRHSMEYFLPTLRISDIHGQPQKIKINYTGDSENVSTNVVILPLYHPAAALYNGKMKVTLFEDFLQIQTIKKLTKVEKLKERIS